MPGQTHTLTGFVLLSTSIFFSFLLLFLFPCCMRLCREINSLSLQKLDVHSKKRKSDHRYFASRPRQRRPRDLDHQSRRLIAASRDFLDDQSRGRATNHVTSTPSTRPRAPIR